MYLDRCYWVFKIDLQRSYHQIFCSVLDAHFVACMLPMALHFSARCCQLVTNATIFIYTKYRYLAINYFNDLGSTECEDRTEHTFATLQQLLHVFGLQVVTEKTLPPSTVIVTLGIKVNTLLLILSIPENKWHEILEILNKWIGKQGKSLKEMLSLTGLLNFACKCFHSGWIYLT